MAPPFRDIAGASPDALLRALAGAGQEERIGIAPGHAGRGALTVSLPPTA